MSSTRICSLPAVVLLWTVLAVGCGASDLDQAGEPQAPQQQAASSATQQEQQRSPASDQPIIPGLHAAEVYTLFMDKGFAVTMSQPTPTLRKWLCVQRTLERTKSVEIYGPAPEEIIHVRGGYINWGFVRHDEVDRQFEEFVADLASIPYEGHNAVEAKEWMMRHFGDNVTTTIGEVEWSVWISVPEVRSVDITSSWQSPGPGS